MIRLTARKIGKLLNRSPKYVYVLLRRKGIKLADVDYEKLIDLICKYRWRRFTTTKNNGKRVHKDYQKGYSKSHVKYLIDTTIFKALYNQCKKQHNNTCAECGNPGYIIHHINHKHSDMFLNNLVLLCDNCHSKHHSF